MWIRHPAPVNFLYPEFERSGVAGGSLILSGARGNVEFSLLDGGALRIRVAQGDGNLENFSRVAVRAVPIENATAIPGEGANWDMEGAASEVAVDALEGTFCFTHAGRIVLESSRLPFGVSGKRQIVLFDRPQQHPVLGLGEKTGALDKSGKSYGFWNVDVVADHPHSFGGDSFDPGYVSIPLYISRFRKDWFGVFLDNPHKSFIHAGLNFNEERLFHPSMGLREKGESVFALGAHEGRLDLYVIPGPTLADVVRGFAHLTGTHDLPPRWALGYHQCRWSYTSAVEAKAIADRLAKDRIPVGALWLDIDYMDHFQVFTWNKKTFGGKDRKALRKALDATSTRLVTIVDPGVKQREGYAVYDSGVNHDVFCRTAEGLPFIGLVWPGRTVFPDYSMTNAADWWAGWVGGWMEEGVDGIWIDMNDPSTGPIDYDDMRFESGTVEHAAVHNQYADLMARATRAGMLAAEPDSRPFILTRSAMAGTQRYAAVWTGDNVSNETHLRMSIPQSINLALSGISFNGPDVGGFIGDCTEELMVAWMLAGAMFPFFRNHSCQGTKPQEIHTFSRAAQRTIRSAIYTRAKLLPYIYTLFHLHQRDGDAVMRPLAYEFSGKKLESIADQYLMGASVMVAPFVDVSSPKRTVELPPGWWFDMVAGKWIKGDCAITVKRSNEMALYIRDGSVLPAVDGNAFWPQPDFAKLSFHVFCRKEAARGVYFEDDGETRAWERGVFNLYQLEARPGRKHAQLEIERVEEGYPTGARRAAIYYYGLAPEGAEEAEVRWPFRSYAVRRQAVTLF